MSHAHKSLNDILLMSPIKINYNVQKFSFIEEILLKCAAASDLMPLIWCLSCILLLSVLGRGIQGHVHNRQIILTMSIIQTLIILF